MIGLVHELPGGIVRIVILPFVWSGCLVVLDFFLVSLFIKSCNV